MDERPEAFEERQEALEEKWEQDEPAPAGEQTLERSHHLDYFRKGDQYFIYHNLWGFILEMDHKVLQLVEAFASPRLQSEVEKEFSDVFEPGQIQGFIPTLMAYRCLKEPGSDERELALGGYLVRGPAAISVEPGGDDVTLGWPHRGRGEIVIEQLNDAECRIWKLADGQHTLRQIIEDVRGHLPQLEDPSQTVLEWVFERTHSDSQALKLGRRPVPEGPEHREAYFRSIMFHPRFDPSAGEAEATPEVTDLQAYHREEISDPNAQFEERETTLSHMFRVPHEVFEGRTYPGAFAARLLEEEALTGDTRKVVEVGGGVGWFARNFLKHLSTEAPEVRSGLHYSILDLSPALQESQRRILGEVEIQYLQGDGCALPLIEESVDLLVSNEVIADFPAVQLDREVMRQVIEQGAVPEHVAPDLRPAYEVFARYPDLELGPIPERFWLNLGAIQMVERLWSVLKSGGRAYISEYGSTWEFPEEATHLDHREVSIHFGVLEGIAQRLGFEASVTPLPEFLEMQEEIPVLVANRSRFMVLRELLRRRDIELKKVAYTVPMLRELLGVRLRLESIGTLEFRDALDRSLGLYPKNFHLLRLRKPLPGDVAESAGDPAPPAD